MNKSRPILHYENFGNGPIDILLVHGWASSSRMWDNITTHMDNVRFWAVDLPGFGETPFRNDMRSLDDYVGALIHFCEVYNLHPQAIIAHSMGGLITLKMLHVRPDLAQQLVLISPVVTGRFGVWGVPSDLLRNPLGQFVLRASEGLWPLMQNNRLLQSALSPTQIDPARLDQLVGDFTKVIPVAGIETLVSMAQQDMQSALTEIQHPTWVAVGAYDFTVPPSEGKTAALYMPNAELTVFEHAAHRPHDEQLDDFLPAIQHFLERFGIS